MDKQQILDIAKEEMESSSLNSFAALGHPEEKIWTKVIGGIAAGDDPLFAFFKKDIGDFFWSPKEAFCRKYPDAQVNDAELSVLVLGFRVDDDTRALQAQQKIAPNFRWLYARNSWEPIIAQITDGLVRRLEEAGIRAAVVDTLPGFAWQKTEKYGYCSNWSHRHAAFTAGLGTFGLCDGLITRIGKALRYTSIILDTKLPADKREYEDIHEWCLFYHDGSCRACINGCPAGAITEAGHNKDKCEAYINEFKSSYRHSRPIDADGPFGCGLCQGAVPCQNGVPAKCLQKKEQK